MNPSFNCFNIKYNKAKENFIRFINFYYSERAPKINFLVFSPIMRCSNNHEKIREATIFMDKNVLVQNKLFIENFEVNYVCFTLINILKVAKITIIFLYCKNFKIMSWRTKRDKRNKGLKGVEGRVAFRWIFVKKIYS